jgi:WD40 repeat protein
LPFIAISGDGKTAGIVSCQLRPFHSNPNYHVQENQKIVIFDIPSGQERLRIPVEGWSPRSFKFTRDGGRLASISGKSAGVWDAQTGKLLWKMPDVGHRISALSFSPDGNRLATALENTNILIWDVSKTNWKQQ